jgi:hypothetical protein
MKVSHDNRDRSVVEDKLRQTHGYIERLEHDAAHPENATVFDDWEIPDSGN